MAKILFVSINDINTSALRLLSACLKEKGHQAYIIFLQRYGFPHNRDKKYIDASRDIEEGDWVGIDREGKEYRYARGPELTVKEIDLLLSLVGEINPDLVGFYVCSPLREKCKKITQLIKDGYGVPIIWGGPEPTADPKACLNYCDFVCIGEGEKAIVDVARHIDNKGDIKKTKNLAYFESGKFIRNPLYPLISDLDELPIKDIYPDNKFFIDDDVLIRNFKEVNYDRNLKYHISSSRGCYNNCSYCNENFIRGLYPHDKHLRRRSPSNVVSELKEAKRFMNYEMVVFEDEIFSFDCSWLSEFKDLYKKEIDLPFVCFVYPDKHIIDRLTMLKEAGLIYVCLALQSGSERINRDIFNRRFNKELFLNTANTIRSMGIGYYTDVITYNPFERERDLQSTLAVLNQMPKPFDLCINKLYAMKGTKIHDLIKNLHKSDKKQSVSNETFNFYCRLFWHAKYKR